MKKILLIVIAFILLGAFDTKAQIKLQEGFEGVTFPPSGWLSQNVLGANQWVRSTAQAHTGTASAFINYQGTGGEDWLKTPVINLGANDTLTFWLRRQFTSAFPPDNMEILLSTTDTSNASYSNVIATINVATLTNATWVEFKYHIGASFSGNVYIAFRHTDSDGNGAWLDDVKVGSPMATANDVGISAASFGSPIKIISVGKGYDLTATVSNYGTATQNVVPVYYDVNGGSAVGPVNTVGPIIQNATENVLFSGGNAFVPATAGAYTIRVWTLLASDEHPSANDTLSFVVNALDKISAFPYTETFTLPTGWTITGNAAWGLANAVNPDGLAADPAAIANFYSISNGSTLILRSPEMDFTGITNPVLDFYVAYKTYTGGESDTLKVMVSTDGGVTFSPASTSYDKSWDSDPSLATLPPASAGYTPTASSQWRHETVDLSNVGNMANVVIGFIGESEFGNNAWIDNVIVSAPNSLCTDAVTGPGVYNCNSIVTLNFTATPVPPVNGNQSTSGVTKSEKSVIESTNNIPFYTGEAVINAFTQNDNPNGGTAFISQYTNNDPGQSIAPNVGNGDATTPNGSVFDPSNVYHDFWFTITYDGNDYQGYATYDISIDITGSGFTIPNELYIVKRTDRTGAWVCQNTTIAGNILTVTGLTDFSDFALAGQEALPVELSSFVSSISGNSVTLNWTTSSEINNSGFDIERSSVSGVWSKVGSVSGNGTSATPNSYTFTERNVASGNYSYRLKQIDFNGNFEYFNLSNEVVIGIPAEFKLSQNYPNPFNPSTTISYEIPVDGAVSLKIFDMSGKEVMSLVDGVKNAGYYSININASNLSSGIYFYKLTANDFTSVKKMMLVK
ncbi:MAG: T9SS type A sorting domain-containing protein [Ignavibacteria bacterium]|nr:T9SS type A sorting domain-containing protein [Ignavibacteria bacterium]